MSPTMASGTVLVVEDESNIASLVSLYLTNEGFRVEHAADGDSALAEFERLKPVLVILDLMIPGTEGFEVCRQIRKTSNVPVIMLTARDQEIDRVLGLELGADDYVTKPFSPRELVARVKAVLRRSGPGGPAPEGGEQHLTLGPIEVDGARREVTVGGRRIELTAKEFDLLEYLIRNRGIVASRSRLLEMVWGWEHAVDSRTVDSHVKSLRRKLGDGATVIKTLRGVGYKADADAQP